MTIFKTITGSPDAIPLTKADTTVPFKSAEDAWFWFIQAQTARNEGARISAGAGLYARPCEPVDIITALERLYRARTITMDHVMVLRHYGQRLLSPDPRRQKEIRAHALWREALSKLEDALVVSATIQPLKLKPLGPAVFSCVEVVKRTLGIRNTFLLTPWQLYKFLKIQNERIL